MAKYRIKKKKYFFPQYKNGFETFWCWRALYRPAFEQYENTDSGYRLIVRFTTLKEAEDFLEKEKEKRKVIIYPR